MFYVGAGDRGAVNPAPLSGEPCSDDKSQTMQFLSLTGGLLGVRAGILTH